MAKRFLYIMALITLVSCSKNRFDVDVSNIHVDVEVSRLDKAIESLKNDSVELQIPRLTKEYGSFLNLYCSQIIRVGTVENAEFSSKLHSFLTYEVFDDITKNIHENFGTDSLLFQKELTDACKHYAYYFPKKTIPHFYTFNGGFNQSIVIDSAIIGIGLDKYLGSNSILYQRLGLELFKRKTMYPGKVVPDCMYALAESEFPFSFVNENLLSTMIHEGRKVYFMKCMMPDLNDTVLWGFSKKQLDFCVKSESDMWNYLVSNKLLFDSDYMNIKRFTGEGPFTTAFSNESPARAAVWIGFNIVASYAEHNSVNLPQLMSENDYQKIMNKSKYNP